MINPETLLQEISSAAGRHLPSHRAHTFIKRPNKTSTRPAWLQCDDNEIYVVKGSYAGRSIFNDHVCGLLGNAMGAPVPSVSLIMVPQELIVAEPQIADFSPGLAHGSLYVGDTSDRLWLAHMDKEYNRGRFALLSVMYGWLCANDNQLIYANQEPYLVYSVDHGFFFPGGPEWKISNFANSIEAKPYEEIRTQCSLTEQEIGVAIQALGRVSTTKIVEAIAWTPDEWGVSLEEKAALASFLCTRQDTMVNVVRA
jgi:hypothetical protein